jgi:hypothetical protein
MKLDKRILGKCHPYDCFAEADVNQWVNKKGWFSNNLEDYANLESSKIVFDTLKAINDTNTPFQNETGNFKYFLPYCMARLEYATYRPYQSVKELPFTTGDIIFLKDKESPTIEKCICSNITSINDSISLITLGTTAYSAKELFENYQWKFTETGDFKVFGEIDHVIR